MKISLNWLREFVDLPADVPELVDLLTLAGVEVEHVQTLGVAIPKIVVAQILESGRHPNADRLSVCKVDDGSGTPRQIVCGAKNFQAGDKVPLALPGAVMPGDFKIKVGKLRGVESEGMMCSAEELGLPKGADGLLILPPDAPVGAPFSDLFPGDTVLDLEITPNRPDLLGTIGIAREVAALTGKPLRLPQVPAIPAYPTGSVAVESPDCAFYSVLAISGVRAGPSPDWLRSRLEAAGLRAINAIVDITNFVMLETGQPLHAFDAAKVSRPIRVRAAADGESFLALDGRNAGLNASHLVIADSHRVLALGGVMGGADSGVSDTTQNILLESACFASSAIRRTARMLGISSDSSYRFERGVDPHGTVSALRRAAGLIVELAGGTPGEFSSGSGSEVPMSGELFADRTAGPAFVRTVALRPERVTALLGTEVASDRIDAILSGFGLRKSGGGWEIPSFRQDLLRDVDLIEEVARVVGIDAIPSRLAASPAVPGCADAAYDFQMTLRQRLSGMGFSEARTSTLVSSGMLWQETPAIRLRNPLGEDQAFLRTSLLPGLLAAVERNVRHGAKRIALFEIGRTFRASGSEEHATAAFVLQGETSAGGWRGAGVRELDWHDAKGAVEALAGIPIVLKKCDAKAPLALAAEIFSGPSRLGVIGQLSPSAARALGAKGPVTVAELDVRTLQESSRQQPFAGIPKFPAVSRDLAIVCPLDLPYAEIAQTLEEAGESLLAAVEPFDVFVDPSGEKLPADRKSLAISLTFRDAGRTLQSEEVNAACERLRQGLKAKLAVEFRE